MEILGAIVLGLTVGLVGTLIGAGGGFLLTPVFLFLYPHLSATEITAMSLVAVFANSSSGSIGYAVRRQIHWPSVFLYAICAVPGVLLGVEIGRVVNRQSFDLLFGIFLFVMAIYIILRSRKKRNSGQVNFWHKKNMVIGSLVSFFVGILSSLLGIGGGIIHVPLLSEVMKYPLHMAAGTSHAILALTSLVAVVDHWQAGDLTPVNPLLPYLCVGLVVGAQAGAHYSSRIANKVILRILAGALILASLRLLIKGLGI